MQIEDTPVDPKTLKRYDTVLIPAGTTILTRRFSHNPTTVIYRQDVLREFWSMPDADHICLLSKTGKGIDMISADAPLFKALHPYEVLNQ